MRVSLCQIFTGSVALVSVLAMFQLSNTEDVVWRNHPLELQIPPTPTEFQNRRVDKKTGCCPAKQNGHKKSVTIQTSSFRCGPTSPAVRLNLECLCDHKSGCGSTNCNDLVIHHVLSGFCLLKHRFLCVETPLFPSGLIGFF